MIQRLLLELAHRAVRTIDGRRDLRPVAMFGLDGVGKAGVVGPEFQLQGTPSNGEARLQRLKLGPLSFVQLEPVMEPAATSSA